MRDDKKKEDKEKEIEGEEEEKEKKKEKDGEKDHGRSQRGVSVASGRPLDRRLLPWTWNWHPVSIGWTH